MSESRTEFHFWGSIQLSPHRNSVSSCHSRRAHVIPASHIQTCWISIISNDLCVNKLVDLLKCQNQMLLLSVFARIYKAYGLGSISFLEISNLTIHPVLYACCWVNINLDLTDLILMSLKKLRRVFRKTLSAIYKGQEETTVWMYFSQSF